MKPSLAKVDQALRALTKRVDDLDEIVYDDGMALKEHERRLNDHARQLSALANRLARVVRRRSQKAPAPKR